MAVPDSDDVATIVSGKIHQPLPVDDMRGRRLAHFEIIEPIGVGGMGAVMKAIDTTLGRLVALKILPPNLATSPEHLDRFQKEARAAARLDHENIAQVYFCGVDAGLHFIAFEFVDGEDLKTLLLRAGPPNVQDATNYMVQVAKGLSHSYQRGVVHRDLKPSNIIVTKHGKVKIVDMGLARMDGPVDQLTRSGATLGTFDYISPEQALDPRVADIRSDIYSLGCTYYHLLTGVPPVPEGTAAKKLHHHQLVQPEDPRSLNQRVPLVIVEILARMMSKHPDNRYQTPDDLVADLDAALDHIDIDNPNSGPRRRPEPMYRPPAGIPRWLALGSILAVVIVVGIMEWAFAPLDRGGFGQTIVPAPVVRPDANSNR